MTHRIRIMWIGLAMVLVGCAGPSPGPSTTAQQTGEAPRAAAPRRVVAAIIADPAVLNTKINPGTVVTPGHGELERLINVGLAIVDKDGVLREQLGEAIPTVENGLWKVLPDGRMETTW